MLNKAVAEFYKNEFRNYEKFRKNLNELIGDIRSDSDEIIEIKDIAILVPLFNKAILLFQLRQPMAALKIILVLIHHLDLVDSLVARRIGLLAVNILLNLNQPKGARDVIELLKSRLSGCPDFSSDEDEELLLDKTLHAKPPKVLSEFKWMFRFYKFRSRIFNERNAQIPIEDVSGMIFEPENGLKNCMSLSESPNGGAEGASILCRPRLPNGGQGINEEVLGAFAERFVSINPSACLERSLIYLLGGAE